ncbi:hypothetical protein ABZP36_023635, partial [Zizania latifolia]
AAVRQIGAWAASRASHRGRWAALAAWGCRRGMGWRMATGGAGPAGAGLRSVGRARAGLHGAGQAGAGAGRGVGGGQRRWWRIGRGRPGRMASAERDND